MPLRQHRVIVEVKLDTGKAQDKTSVALLLPCTVDRWVLTRSCEVKLRTDRIQELQKPARKRHLSGEGIELLIPRYTTTHRCRMGDVRVVHLVTVNEMEDISVCIDRFIRTICEQITAVPTRIPTTYGRRNKYHSSGFHSLRRSEATNLVPRGPIFPTKTTSITLVPVYLHIAIYTYIEIKDIICGTRVHRAETNIPAVSPGINCHISYTRQDRYVVTKRYTHHSQDNDSRQQARKGQKWGYKSASPSLGGGNLGPPRQDTPRDDTARPPLLTGRTRCGSHGRGGSYRRS